MPRPDTGSQPSDTENTIASSGPSQKFGIEIPMSASVVATWSMLVPARTAAMMPSGIAMSTATNIDAAASSNVAGIRSAIAAATA